ncbi:anthranilate synthase component I [Streptomyces sp. NRRL S-87]|uniref:anthranilate synthase component I n=1 Tax=Streptomyces sp. NRRL S-87 TaxID=1463920 RepID=UPI0007C48971|nr:anthranilate synthase component I [Streptomyces sp. NRRL S-87]
MTLSVHSWPTPGGLRVTRTSQPLDPRHAQEALADLESRLGRRRGLLLSGRTEQPGRYRPYDLGHADPPLELTLRAGRLELAALNDRGLILLDALGDALQPLFPVERQGAHHLVADLPDPDRDAPAAGAPEEDRTRRASLFAALRAVVAALASPQDPVWGLYGAFGYDLALDFDPVPRHQERDPRERTVVLHLPDTVLERDPHTGAGTLHRYEFEYRGRSSHCLPRTNPPAEAAPPADPPAAGDHEPGAYAALVRRAQERFRAGDLFEAVPGQVFHRRADTPPVAAFRRLRARNPAPYGLLMNLAEGEHLVGASPEMFVRVDAAAGTVESCPISGTVARGADALEDAQRVRELLGSAKEESELTMCTDVDRNDKARVCLPGTVEVLARRHIELYATLIHTVDHVRGRLRPDRDALDAFVSHMWAVTVTGAPKRAAIAFVERHERSPRRWYGGAVGRIGFDGGLETALTLRTVHYRDGVASVRAGATLLYDSDPEAEERETRLKAKALLEVLEPAGAGGGAGADGTADESPGSAVGGRSADGAAAGVARGRPARVLLVDHQDSFVHTLADFLRRTGAEVTTYRAGFPPALLDELRPDLLVLSPGPGRPADFGMAALLDAARERELPVFGVCLGLQGLVEYFGGRLGTLERPVHGKPSTITVAPDAGALFAGLPSRLAVGRYHSLYVRPEQVPAGLRVTAATDDGVVMAVEHRELPLAAVQFHPESLMSMAGGAGERIIANAVAALARPGAVPPLADRPLAELPLADRAGADRAGSPATAAAHHPYPSLIRSAR